MCPRSRSGARPCDSGAQRARLDEGQNPACTETQAERDELNLAQGKFGPMALARAYIDTVQESIGSLAGGALIDALERLDYAYDAFPELELERPRGQLVEGLRLTAESMPNQAAIPLPMYCASANPAS